MWAEPAVPCRGNGDERPRVQPVQQGRADRDARHRRGRALREPQPRRCRQVPRMAGGRRSAVARVVVLGLGVVRFLPSVPCWREHDNPTQHQRLRARQAARGPVLRVHQQPASDARCGCVGGKRLDDQPVDQAVGHQLVQLSERVRTDDRCARHPHTYHTCSDESHSCSSVASSSQVSSPTPRRWCRSR